MAMSGYVRVSRVAGRSGESYGSPKEQEESIRRWASSQGVELAEVVVEEDVSGAKKADDRDLGRLIAAVEAGESEGIVTYRLSRFGRSLLETLTSVERLKEAGGRLVTVADGIDTDSSTGKLLLGVLGTLAEVELDQRRDYWDASARRAVARGVHPAPVPLGYVRGPGGRLELDELRSAPVAHCFEERARGTSWQALSDWLAAHGVSISSSGVQAMIASRVYRGEAFKGRHVNPTAHPAIVSEEVWQAAQLGMKRPDRNGSVATQGFLVGLVTCAGCSKRMSTNSGSHGQASYYCKRTRKVPCPAPGAMSVRRLDEYVEPFVLERLEQGMNVQKAFQEQGEATKELVSARDEMEAFLAHASASELGEFYGQEIARRREALREAQARVDNSMNVPGAVTPTQWKAMSDVARRAAVAPLLEQVIVSRSTRGRWQPIEERVEIAWR